MARRKANLRTRPKSVTLERASSQDANEVGDQETHEASTQGSDVQPAIRVTRGPNKYLEIWDLLDDQEIELPLNSMHQPVDEGARTFTGFLGTIARKPHMCPIKYLDWKAMPEKLKEECWRLVKRKYQVPDNPKAYEGLKKFTLQKIGKAWRDHKCRLKAKHYIPHSRNKARVKSNRPRKCILEDWDILVDHWYTDDAVIESDKNKDRRSKQDDIHTGGSCGYVMHAAKKAKTDGHPIERAVLFQILRTRKDGSAVNPVMKEKMDKMKELLVDPKNQLQSFDRSGSIAWSTDDVFAKVMGKERKGRIRGVGFGPTPSGQSSKTTLTDSEIQSSQARDNELAQLKASLATMEEKLVGFDKMKEKISQFEEMEQRMARMFQQMQQISTQCNQDAPLIEQSPALSKSSAASHQPRSL
ncbi:uncharacterized protein LOC126693581 isoform X1 [Quercus robur]|uniref:uncharacterized protein LOC126693581 isoform X1 n=1 Tax=Quercus robur TaxID=38942 RepID=UPI00216313EC|nr:uncharacterized protein LOC126693581 isoform X1 [Quercus robur]XP_050245548.1 uncharacterized protein LOC126693581 isoform X1 [Quercus robur]XP_050245549.1 uncharacterized protein LOC126693581 isoform X1 [Quercus robur]XP_050245550.1 uncharacterized protein LOC126693581 isoform X1 [Quercus robur]XP_050245551.1 uncharacterized protein LOC126693581 isoform X1 [Quercus robur]XP_050245552.1 uncharacterized protein LOC126693581 isoform X1 [Quercus robur]XP_050245553.1 uncharacterized protein LO